MKHLNEQEMVLHHFGDDEGEAKTGAAAHLAACPECAAESARLSAWLEALREHAPAVPERGSEYGRELWVRISPGLEARSAAGWRAWLAPHRAGWAAAAAALLLVAFLAGRYTRVAPVATTVAQTEAGQGRDRILLIAVGDHLEQSQMILVELANAEAGRGPVNIAPERQRARELLAANRLYEQSARNADEVAVQSVLDDLERVLVEVANSPSELDGAQLRQIQQQIESQGLLFKVRVIGAKVQSKAQSRPRQEKTVTGKAKAGRA